MKIRDMISTAVTMAAFAAMLNCQATLAQAPPTATEAFNLRVKCKALADDKAEAMKRHPMSVADGATLGLSAGAVDALNRKNDARSEVLQSWHSSRYDIENNRCYIELFEHRRFGVNKENEAQYRQIYDGQTDDLLAFTRIENGKKVGMVFDPEHDRTTDDNLGWDDANAYIDEMMLDKRI